MIRGPPPDGSAVAIRPAGPGITYFFAPQQSQAHPTHRQSVAQLPSQAHTVQAQALQQQSAFAEVRVSCGTTDIDSRGRRTSISLIMAVSNQLRKNEITGNDAGAGSK